MLFSMKRLDYLLRREIDDPMLKTKDYETLISMLELKFQKGNPFSTKAFFEELNIKIPSKIQVIEKLIISKVYQCEEAEKVYIKDIRDWNKYPYINKKCSKENKEKTRLLYPELYDFIKDKNISVFYTDNKKKDGGEWRNKIK